MEAGGLELEKKETERRLSKKIQSVIPQPWETFAQEFMALYGYRAGREGLNHDPNESMELIPGAAEKYGIDSENRPLKPLLVSWKARRGVRGQVHKETIYGIKHIADSENEEKNECFFKKIPLTELNYEKLDNMAGAFDSRTGEATPMYTMLRKRLEEYGGDAKKAFVEEIRKGNRPNSPVIRKVRIKEKVGGAVRIQGGVAGNGDMIRVDVFQRKNKKGIVQYFLIPIYMKHRTYEDLPMKAIIAHKPEKEWEEMQDEEFLCSLYTNDYIRIEKKNETQEGYYVGVDRSTGKLVAHPADSRKDWGSGVKTGILSFTKYSVDILGNKQVVHLPERRMGLTRPGQRG